MFGTFCPRERRQNVQHKKMLPRTEQKIQRTLNFLTILTRQSSKNVFPEMKSTRFI